MQRGYEFIHETDNDTAIASAPYTSSQSMPSQSSLSLLYSSFLSHHLLPLLHGQYISLLISGTGFFASLLSSKNSNCPILLSTLNYLLLSTYLLRLSWSNSRDSSDPHPHHQHQQKHQSPYPSEQQQCNPIISSQYNLTPSSPSSTTPPIADSSTSPFSSFFSIQLSQPLWVYFLISLIDIEANTIINTAYNYTSITSIMLLDCFSIPCVMVLSVFFLYAKFTLSHYYGVCICLIGMGCIILTDTYFHHKNNNDDDESVASNPLKGDILCLIGTCLYAMSNVIQEKLVKTYNRLEFLGMLGMNGFFIGIIQFFIVEYDRFQSITWSYEIILYTIGYTLCLFFMYSNTSSFLTSNDATLFNLSLLTSDVYAVIFAYFVFHYHVHWMYYIAFLFTLLGLSLYYRGGQPTSSEKIRIQSTAADSEVSDGGYIMHEEDDGQGESGRREGGIGRRIVDQDDENSRRV